jgi:hypothetical protein
LQRFHDFFKKARVYFIRMDNSFLRPKVKCLLILMIRFVIMIGLCIWLFSQMIRAQYRFDSWTTDNGLPQNGVRGIAQTSDGYLWFTTFDGLVRFDGLKFTVYASTSAAPRSSTASAPGFARRAPRRPASSTRRAGAHSSSTATRSRAPSG